MKHNSNTLVIQNSQLLRADLSNYFTLLQFQAMELTYIAQMFQALGYDTMLYTNKYSERIFMRASKANTESCNAFIRPEGYVFLTFPGMLTITKIVQCGSFLDQTTPFNTSPRDALENNALYDADHRIRFTNQGRSWLAALPQIVTHEDIDTMVARYEKIKALQLPKPIPESKRVFIDVGSMLMGGKVQPMPEDKDITEEMWSAISLQYDKWKQGVIPW